MARTPGILARPFVLLYQSDNAPFRVDHGFGIDVGVNLARFWSKKSKPVRASPNRKAPEGCTTNQQHSKSKNSKMLPKSFSRGMGKGSAQKKGNAGNTGTQGKKKGHEGTHEGNKETTRRQQNISKPKRNQKQKTSKPRANRKPSATQNPFQMLPESSQNPSQMLPKSSQNPSKMLQKPSQVAPPGGVLKKTTFSTTFSSTLVPKAPPQSLPNGTQKSSKTKKTRHQKTKRKTHQKIPPTSSQKVAKRDHFGVFFHAKRPSEPERGIFTKHQYSLSKTNTSVRGRSPKDLKKPPRGHLFFADRKQLRKSMQKASKKGAKRSQQEAKTSNRAPKTNTEH